MFVRLGDWWQEISNDLEAMQISEETLLLLDPYLSSATIRWFGRAARRVAESRGVIDPGGNPVQGQDVSVVLQMINFPLNLDNPESRPFRADNARIFRFLHGGPEPICEKSEEFADHAYDALRLITGRAIDLTLTTANQEAVREGQGNHGTEIIEAGHVFKHCDRLPYPLSLWLC